MSPSHHSYYYKRATQGFIPNPPSGPEGLDDPFVIALTGKCNTVHDGGVGGRPALLLGMLGTLPSQRHRGAGGMHLVWANEIADREGLVCYAEASPMALPLYEQFGYEQVEGGAIVSLVLDGGTYT
ncbi:hypothetical protein AB5N19_13033 [Seiridium cardinale]